MSPESENNDQNLPEPTDKPNQEVVPIEDPRNLMGEAIKRMTPEQQKQLLGKAGIEALRLQVKAADGDIDSDITKKKTDSVIETARRLSGGPTRSYRVETEHAGTRVTVQKGCLQVLLILASSSVFIAAIVTFLR